MTESRIKRWVRLNSSDSMLTSGVFLIISNIAIGLGGYIYQIIVGRSIGPAEFAIFSTIMALSQIFGAPLGALLMVVSKAVAEAKGKADNELPSTVYGNSFLVISILSIIGFFTIIQGLDQLKIILNIDREAEYIIFWCYMTVNAFAVVNMGLIQGAQRFLLLAGIGVIGVIVKIIVTLLAINISLNAMGALCGVMISALIVWIAGVYVNLKEIKRINFSAVFKLMKKPTGVDKLLPILVANVCFAVMTQLDVIWVNKFFSSEQAGLYAAVAVLGKAILYLPGGLVFAMYPIVAEQHAKEKINLSILKKVVIVSIALCGVAILFYWVAGEQMMILLYGPAYAEVAGLLKWYAIAVFPLSLVMVAEYFLIASGRVIFGWLFLLVAPIQVMALSYWNSELWMIVAVFGVGGGLLCIIGYLLILIQNILSNPNFSER